MRHRLSVAGWLALLLLAGTANAHAMPSLTQAGQMPDMPEAAHGLMRLAQAQVQTPTPLPPTQPPSPAPAPTAATAQPADAEPIGNVATLTGSATVTRNNAATPLKLKDDIFQNDVLQTSANSTLGVTFNDATTFNLTANATITVDNYLYEDGGKQNAALFDIAKGTVAFVAASVAHTGDMKISTPTASLGIRGTTGLVEVPEGAAANNPNNVAIKLYPDADGRVGRIEVNDRSGARLGALTQGSSGFTIRPGAGGRFSAAPLLISPQQAQRDQGIVRQVHAAQSVGRQIVTQQRALRQANPNRNNPARNNLRNNQAPNQRNNPAARPGLQRQNNLQQRPGSPQAPNGQNRQGQLQPGARPAPGVQPPNAPAVRQAGAPQPALQRPAAPNRPAVRRPPPPKPQKKR
ncbi:FecR domain-containing protein [Bradyrhizobium sp. S69]|uniref:FecR domain-containing protein n=1 Tax=Bradyrhizobium sp. S69 TaxID=1641856 RepID=UPI001FEFB0D6|nr:FecR domain-containing protein [Bradyrhizobium sp. S69]